MFGGEFGLSISPIYSYSGSSYSYQNILPPFVDRAEITMGLFSVPSADPLYTSSTSYGTNANPLVGGPYYHSSAEELQKIQYNNKMAELQQSQALDELDNGDSVDEYEDLDLIDLESIDELYQAYENEAVSETVITENTDLFTEVDIISPKTSTENIVFSGSPFRETDQVRFEANQPDIFNQQNYFSNPVNNALVQLSGANTSVSYENAINFASVNANYQVQFSEEGQKAIKDLQNIAAKNEWLKRDLSEIVDGMIPLSAATLFDFASPLNYNATQPRLLDRFVKALQKLTNSRSYGEEAGG